MPRYLLLIILTACATPQKTLKYSGAPPPPRPYPGAGAPRVGQPGTMRPSPPRSPHRRVLPPSRSPGIWAGDQPKVPRELRDPWVLGVRVPLALDGLADADRMPDACVAQVRADLIPLDNLRTRLLGEADTRCLVGRLFANCVERAIAERLRLGAKSEWRKTLVHVRGIAAEWCKQPGSNTSVVNGIVEKLRAKHEDEENEE